jgi:hypothetical protein
MGGFKEKGDCIKMGSIYKKLEVYQWLDTIKGKSQQELFFQWII